MRKTCFYLFYKKKRICRIHLPNMKKGETCEFGVNIHDRFFHKDRRELVFKLKKGKRFRTYKSGPTADRQSLLIVFFYI